MQKACEQNPSTMAAVLGLDFEVVENICNEIKEVVVPTTTTVQDNWLFPAVIKE